MAYAMAINITDEGIYYSSTTLPDPDGIISQAARPPLSPGESWDSDWLYLVPQGRPYNRRDTAELTAMFDQPMRLEFWWGGRDGLTVLDSGTVDLPPSYPDTRRNLFPASKGQTFRVRYTNIGTEDTGQLYLGLRTMETPGGPSRHSLHFATTDAQTADVNLSIIEAKDATGIYDKIERQGNSLQVHTTGRTPFTEWLVLVNIKNDSNFQADVVPFLDLGWEIIAVDQGRYTLGRQ